MSDDFDFGPFDPDELVRWAENYGHPEQWVKKAQTSHGQNEALRAALIEVREAMGLTYLEQQAARQIIDRALKVRGT